MAFDNFIKRPIYGKSQVASLLDLIDMDDIPGTQEFLIRID